MRKREWHLKRALSAALEFVGCFFINKLKGSGQSSAIAAHPVTLVVFLFAILYKYNTISTLLKEGCCLLSPARGGAVSSETTGSKHL